MMNKSRRGTLQLFGIGLSLATTQSHARQFAQATVTNAPTTPSPEASAAPGPFVNGTYEVTYQEGYAPAFLSVGFPESAVFAMHPAGSQQMTITVTEKVMWLRTRGGGPEQQIALNAPVSTQVFGVTVKDWLARFDTPSRLLISFTAPNGRMIRATQTYQREGYITRLSIESAPQFAPMRVWSRVSAQEERKRQKAYLVPL
jgi:hypothetical protein